MTRNAKELGTNDLCFYSEDCKSTIQARLVAIYHVMVTRISMEDWSDGVDGIHEGLHMYALQRITPIL